MSASSLPLLLPNRLALKPPKPRPIPALFRRKTEITVASVLGDRNMRSVRWRGQECSSIPSMISAAKNLGLRTSPELGLLSLLFVISTALGAFLSLAIISLPTMNAFRKLAVSMDKLSKVVLEEVPGTLSSLKLSGLEINDLTSQLSNLRKRISGNQYKKRERTSKTRSNSNNPIVN